MSLITAEFRRLVEERGAALRERSCEELLAMGQQPMERVDINGRIGTIDIIVEPRSDGSLRVVVQGFLRLRLLPFASSVALDGFYKRPDGNVDPMPDREFYEFD